MKRLGTWTGQVNKSDWQSQGLVDGHVVLSKGVENTLSQSGWLAGLWLQIQQGRACLAGLVP